MVSKTIQIKNEKIKQEEKFKLQICERCNERNSPSAKFCQRCGSPLKVKTVLRMEELRRQTDQIMNILIQDIEFRELLHKKIGELNLI